MSVQFDAGPATNNGVVAGSVEFHAPIGLNPIESAAVGYPSIRSATAAAQAPVSKIVSGIQFNVPA